MKKMMMIELNATQPNLTRINAFPLFRESLFIFMSFIFPLFLSAVPFPQHLAPARIFPSPLLGAVSRTARRTGLQW